MCQHVCAWECAVTCQFTFDVQYIVSSCACIRPSLAAKFKQETCNIFAYHLGVGLNIAGCNYVWIRGSISSRGDTCFCMYRQWHTPEIKRSGVERCEIKIKKFSRLNHKDVEAKYTFIWYSTHQWFNLAPAKTYYQCTWNERSWAREKYLLRNI